MNFREYSVELSYDEWDEIVDERMELRRLRRFEEEQHQRNKEYVSWSLGGGPLAGALALIDYGRSV
jgi:hypothetical protein